MPTRLRKIRRQRATRYMGWGQVGQHRASEDVVVKVMQDFLNINGLGQLNMIHLCLVKLDLEIPHLL